MSRKSNIVDNEAFAFSVTKQKIYNIIKGKTAIDDSNNKGSCFSGIKWYLININKKMLESKSNTLPASQSHYEGIVKNYELNNGEMYFFIKEIEIFHILEN